MVDALCAGLLELGTAPAVDLGVLADGDALENTLHLWGAHCAAFGLLLLDDHDPHVAPGLHVARVAGPLALARVRQLTRSWETFDRAFEACPMEQEQALFDDRIAPCFAALGMDLERMDLARDHLFMIDDRYVALFPGDRWDAHAARQPAPRYARPDHEARLCGLRRVTALKQARWWPVS